MLEAAIVLLDGFTMPDYRTEGSGLWLIKDELEQRYFDRRSFWLGLRTWDANVEEVAKELARRGVRKIVVVCYSWGAGRAFIRFAMACRELGLVIDFVVLIDPVVYDGFLIGKAANALLPSGSPFKLPEGVLAFSSYRTLNKKKLTDPWGRDVRPEGAETLARRRVVFGTTDAVIKYQPAATEWIEDAEVVHTTIDQDARVRTGVLDEIAQECPV